MELYWIDSAIYICIMWNYIVLDFGSYAWSRIGLVKIRKKFQDKGDCKLITNNLIRTYCYNKLKL
jgi:hypothetical protein